MYRITALILLAVLSWHARADRCQPEGEVAAILEDVEKTMSYCMRDFHCNRQALDQVEAGLERFADNVHLHRKRQDLAPEYVSSPFFSGTEADAERIKAIRQTYASGNPSDMARLNAYLSARLEQDIDGLEQAARTWPTAHLDLVAIERGKRNPWKAESSKPDPERIVRASLDYYAACPGSAVATLKVLDEHIVRLDAPLQAELTRKSIEDASDDAWHRIMYKWYHMDRNQADAGTATEQIEHELATVENFTGQKSSIYWNMIAAGHHLTGNDEAMERAQEKSYEIDPCQFTLPHQDLPFAKSIYRESDPLDVKFQAAESAINACPETLMPYMAWLALAENNPEMVDLDKLRSYASAIESYSVNGSDILLDPLMKVRMKKNFQADKAWAYYDRELQQLLEAYEQPGDAQKHGDVYLGMAFSRMARLIREAIRLDDSERARRYVQELREIHADLQIDDSDLDHQSRNRENHYYTALAEWAAHKERWADAVSYGLKAQTYGREDLDDSIRVWWNESGGTGEGLAVLRQIMNQSGTLPWQGWWPVERTMPDVAFEDLQGKTWTPADFAGKPKLINVWANWCGPCIQELTALDALNRELQSEADPPFEIITLNIDEKRAHMQRFLDKHEFDLPVIFHPDRPGTARIFEILDIASAIPHTWILDSTGTIRWETGGYSAKDDFENEIRTLVGRLGSSEEKH